MFKNTCALILIALAVYVLDGGGLNLLPRAQAQAGACTQVFGGGSERVLENLKSRVPGLFSGKIDYHKFRRDFDNYVLELSPEMSSAHATYASSDYVNMNRVLRAGLLDMKQGPPAQIAYDRQNPQPWKDSFALRVSYNLIKLFEHSPEVPQHAKLYRGLHMLEQSIPAKGSVHTEKAFLSTSLYRSSAEFFTRYDRGPNDVGLLIEFINLRSDLKFVPTERPTEFEIVLPPGTRYKIIEIHRDQNGDYQATAEIF